MTRQGASFASQTHPAMRCSSIRLMQTCQKIAARQANVCFATKTSTGARRRKRETTADRNTSEDEAMQAMGSTTLAAAEKQTAAKQNSSAVQFGRPPSDPAFDKPASWVVFSDLHMSSKTVDTAMEVLDVVYREASSRGAGVMFLGDFWDRRGDLPVVPLNRVQECLRSWVNAPLLLLPGNHDQVDLGGQEHSLYSLQMAAPCAHVFTQPTLFKDSLWLPYRRNETEVREAIRLALQQGPLKAIFGHADVLTAHMNASYQARDGLPPDLFPGQVPAYLGHYHYPHTVTGTSITYIGSPFQVTASEAGQQKRLLLLDNSWQQTGEIPLDIGRRFFTFSAPGSSEIAVAAADQADSAVVADASGTTTDTVDAEGSAGAGLGLPGYGGYLLSPDVVQGLVAKGALRRGDVAQLKAVEENEELQQVQKMLQETGVQVQLHLRPSSHPVARIQHAEQLSMQQLLEQYASNIGMAEGVLQKAHEALKELGSRSSETPTHSHLELQAVTVEGFGPFKGEVTYPLADRGVVAVTGRNEDDAAAVSNGAGKTSLLTALLWAFKAPDGRGLVNADYINEDSKRATVTVTGHINQEPFALVRSTPSKLPLRLTVGGQDLTGQQQSITEKTLEQHFSASLLPKTLVFTQEDLLALLQSSDAAFKELLSSVIDINAWQDAKVIAFKNVTQTKEQLRDQDNLAERIKQEIGTTEKQLLELQEQVDAWKQLHNKRLANAQQTKSSSKQQVLAAADAATALQQQLAEAAALIAAQQKQLQEGKAVAHAAAEKQAAETENEAAAAAASPSQQHEDEDEPGFVNSIQQQEQQQQQLSQFDETAAEKELQPLRANEVAAREHLKQQEGRCRELKGQLTALNARRTKYKSLLLTESNSSGGSHSAHAVSATAADITAAAAPAAGPKLDGDGKGSRGLAPVCEQCLQPINLDLYQRNLNNMAAEEQHLQQQLDAALQLEQKLQEQHTKAQQQLQASINRHSVQRSDIAAQNQCLLKEMREQQEQMKTEARERQAAMQRQLEEQQRQKQAALQRIWEEDRRLERQLNVLDQLASRVAAVQNNLQSSLARASSKLQLQLPPDFQSGSSSCTSEKGTASAEVELLVSQLSGKADDLYGQISDAADSLTAVRGELQQLAAEQNPHASGVAIIEGQLRDKQQELKERQNAKLQLSKQLDCWRRVDLAFGRTGIQSFILEGTLGELQSACSRHLSQLAAGMSLELSATSEKKTAKKSGGSTGGKKATAAKGGRAKGRRSTAAVAAEHEAAPLDADFISSSSNHSSSTVAVGSAADSDELDMSGVADATEQLLDPETLDTSAAPDQKEEIAKIVRVRAAGGEMRQRSIAQLSGGEKKRVALALGLGFAELVAARGRLKSNVLVLDEVLEKLDEEGCLCVAQLLKSLPYSSVFVMGQAGSFVTKEFASVDTVVKAGGCSRIEVGAAHMSA